MGKKPLPGGGAFLQERRPYTNYKELNFPKNENFTCRSRCFLIGEWEYIPVGISGDYMDLLTLKRVEKNDDIIVNIG